MLQQFSGLVILYIYVIIVLHYYVIEAYRIIRLGVRINKCTQFVVTRRVP